MPPGGSPATCGGPLSAAAALLRYPVQTGIAARYVEGNDMSTIKAFLEAGKSLITLGARTNADARQEIREVTGQLADELDRGLMLADEYLVGARHPRDDQALSAYLYEARGRLMDSCREHQVCAGLYQLADKFGQTFDPTRFSVSLDAYAQIPRLIEHLRDGERAVIDDFDELIGHFYQHALALDAAPAGDRPRLREQALASAEAFRVALAGQRKRLREGRREIVDRL